MRPAGGIVIRETFIHVSRGLMLEANYYTDKPVSSGEVLAR
ncbi:hypothetical protein ACFLUU_05115 [Chloroflexota bacterium]